jgi:dipeptidase
VAWRHLSGYQRDKAFWIFNILENLVDLNYGENIQMVKPVWKKFKKDEFSMQQVIEDKALELLKENLKLCATYLTRYCNGVALKAQEKARKMIRELREKHFGY